MPRWNILAALEQAGLIALGDKGFHGYDKTWERVITPPLTKAIHVLQNYEATPG